MIDDTFKSKSVEERERLVELFLRASRTSAGRGALYEQHFYDAIRVAKMLSLLDVFAHHGKFGSVPAYAKVTIIFDIVIISSTRTLTCESVPAHCCEMMDIAVRSLSLPLGTLCVNTIART